MKHIVEWYERHHKIINFFLSIILVLLVVFPFIVNWLYIKGTSMEKPVFVTLYSAGDLLAAWGNILTFLGTIVLGFIAVYQNYKLQELSENQYKEQRCNSQRPDFVIDNISYTSHSYTKNEGFTSAFYCEVTGLSDTLEIDIFLRNVGEGLANNIMAHTNQNEIELMPKCCYPKELTLLRIKMNKNDNNRLVLIHYQNRDKIGFMQALCYNFYIDDKKNEICKIELVTQMQNKIQ